TLSALPAAARTTRRARRRAAPGSNHVSWVATRIEGVGLRRPLVLLVVVDLGELRVDHIVLLVPAGTAGLAARRRAGAALGLLVHRLAELHRHLRERIGLGRDGLRVVALEGLLEVRHGVLDRAAIALADLRAVLGQRLLGRVDQRLGVVLGLDRGLALLVLV